MSQYQYPITFRISNVDCNRLTARYNVHQAYWDHMCTARDTHSLDMQY